MRLVVAAALLLAGCGGSNSSPEAVFEAAKKAVESKDWKGFYQCCDPEKAPEMIMGGLMMAGFSVMQDKEGEKELNEISRRHGFDPENKGAMAKGNPKEVLKSVKDPAGFFHDLMTFSSRKSKKGEEPKMDVTGQLTDVKIQGESATGTLTTKDGKKTPTRFVRRDGSWYISPGK